jgi:hypothetical protein
MNRPVRSIRLAGLLCATVTAGLAIFACTDRKAFEETQPFLPPIPEGGTPEASAPPTCGLHCSRDLKQVLDGCEGAETVLAQCNPDQGCGNEGKCVDACTAAAQTKGSAGCDFWTVPPDVVQGERGSCFAAMVANTWDRGVTLTADRGDTALNITESIFVVDRLNDDPVYTRLEGPLAPGKVAVVFLAHDETRESIHCPATAKPAMLIDPILHGTGRSKAFHLKSDAPISAYSIYPYGGVESAIPAATLLLPTSSWTRNYVAVSPFDFGSGAKRRTLQIVANEDDTQVSMLPTIDIVAGSGVAGGPAGVPQTWTLAKGEVLQFLQASMTGSPIESTKPIALFGGSECSFVPAPLAYCDTLHQQIPPFAQWGSEYAVVPFKPRIESFSPDVRELVPYTIVGAVDGTTLTYEPLKPRGAPETLRAGESTSFMTEDLFVVKSQDSKHPFHVNVYMTGATYQGLVSGSGGHTLGDPDFVNVAPSNQFLDRYVFFTDFTYPDTTLTIVRRKTANGFAPVELECAGEVTGFAPLGASGEYEYAWVQLTRAFVGEKFAKGSCSYGRQEAHSTGPFSVTVWGIGAYASYGYVGGVGLRPINDAPPPRVK